MTKIEPHIQAHQHSTNSKKEIEQSTTVGCFYCTDTFKPTEIEEWIDNNQTPLCPSCGIDLLIGDKSGYPITKEFLSQMRDYWF